MSVVPPPAMAEFGFVEQAEEAERKLLGGLIRFPESADHVAMHVDRSHFQNSAIGEAVHLLCDLHAAGRIDIGDDKAITYCLKGAGLLEKLGGAKEIATIVFLEAPLFASNMRLMTSEVIRFSKLRALARSAVDVMRQLNDPNADPDQIAELASIAQTGTKGVESVSLSDMMSDLADDMQRRLQNPEATFAVHTGIDTVDDLTGGIQSGELVYLGARTSVGKTAFAVQVALDAAMRGTKTLMLSLEMRQLQIAHRYAAMTIDGLSILDLRTGNFGSAEVRAVKEKATELANVPLRVQPAYRATVKKIRSQARSHKAIHGLDFLIVDYVQLIQGDPRQSRFDQVTHASNELKVLALELDIPILALAQLNRQGTDKPTLAHFRDSGSIEQDGDMCWLLHREADHTALIVGKNRQGSPAELKLHFDGDRCRFSEEPIEHHPNFNHDLQEFNK